MVTWIKEAIVAAGTILGALLLGGVIVSVFGVFIWLGMVAQGETGASRNKRIAAGVVLSLLIWAITTLIIHYTR